MDGVARSNGLNFILHVCALQLPLVFVQLSVHSRPVWIGPFFCFALQSFGSQCEGEKWRETFFYKLLFVFLKRAIF
jgi:hypothetical protein